MFEQALLNLLNNTLVHGGPGVSQVGFTAALEAGMLVVRVSDDGKGIAPSDFAKSLGRFSQIGPSPGSGLGLPIAAAVAQSFGGDITLDRRDGRFEVALRVSVAGPGA